MDFFDIEVERQRNGTYFIIPSFLSKPSKDLMVRGTKFYAVWNEETGLWSRSIFEAVRLIDDELKKFADNFLEKNKLLTKNDISVKYLKDFKNHKYKEFVDFIKTFEDNYIPLDSKIIFSNQEAEKKDYCSFKLDYALEEGDTSAWDELLGKLYSKTEREKIEWAIGSMVTGDSKKIQKFFLFYGDPGTGKSTIINIITSMFEKYSAEIDAKAVVSTNDNFGLSCLSTNPLLLIQHDVNLSKVEDNSKLNSLVSHEKTIVNEKFVAPYTIKPQALIILGTNLPVKITDGKSGIIRRLVDIIPTGETFGTRDYNRLMKKIEYEYGAIAWKCKELYLDRGKTYYSSYRPIEMMYRTNPFFNFVEYYSDTFYKQDGTNLQQAYEMYKTYIQESGSRFQISRSEVRDALKDYFKVYKEDMRFEDGTRIRYYYSGFKIEKLRQSALNITKKDDEFGWLKFEDISSRFDKELTEAPAQYANDDGNPQYKWINCLTHLKDLDTTKLHWVRVPENHIVIDFDIKDGDKKSFKKNLEAASQWPPTYAELSKSGEGIHLHYIYTGDPTALSKIYADNVEIKVFTGNASLRRKLTKCNDLPFTTISSGLPLKEGGKKVVDAQTLSDEKQLRALIKGNLQKKYLPATKPSMDFINKLCSDAYSSGMKYDISDMGPAIMAFAANSSNNASYCLDIFSKLKLKSDEPSAAVEAEIDRIVFFDVEVFPNLFLVNWKFQGQDEPVHRMINPTPEEIAFLIKHKLVGFNCRRYDNHILYGRLIGETNFQLFNRSKMIINEKSSNGFFGEAYNLSYTDIYDFCSEKKSLKKWEIELGLHHMELGLKWDEPVPEEKWDEVAAYCDNDVISTEAVWNARQGDFIAREILADIAGMTVNDTTNSLTTKIIFGSNRNPQSEFNYRDMGEVPVGSKPDILPSELIDQLCFPEFTQFYDGLPVFPGYSYINGQSSYRGEEFGEGGYVYAEPGMYWDAEVEDVASMHPSSVIAEELFGPVYTKIFAELVQARKNIKHGNFDACKDLLGGKLMKYLTDKSMAKALSSALKIAINSVYGLTSAKFPNAFRDPRNVDNIVAKRGELFMINLKHEVQAKGFTVIHIKTDSIKIHQPTQEIIDFVVAYGKLYGYDFELENHFDCVTLVNDAVFIAKRADDDPEYVDECKKAEAKGSPIPTPWVATGAQFAVPYVFKSLFSHEEITLDDLCETKSCNTSLYLDFNEDLPKDDHMYVFVGRIGQFCPVIDGVNGGVLLREQGDKFVSVTGTKGYRWKESEIVRINNLEDQINRDYYKNLCDEAVATIEKFGSFEEFVA